MKYNGHTAARRYKFLIRECVKTVLQCENVNVPCRVDVTITDNGGIQVLNKKFMRKDRPTDVLSFPSNEGDALSAVPDGFLGDIAISIDRAKAQAEEYGHSFERELSFLTVHGCLHILGYDHMNDEERQEMFALQDKILNDMGITR